MRKLEFKQRHLFSPKNRYSHGSTARTIAAGPDQYYRPHAYIKLKPSQCTYITVSCHAHHLLHVVFTVLNIESYFTIHC